MLEQRGVAMCEEVLAYPGLRPPWWHRPLVRRDPRRTGGGTRRIERFGWHGAPSSRAPFRKFAAPRRGFLRSCSASTRSSRSVADVERERFFSTLVPESVPKVPKRRATGASGPFGTGLWEYTLRTIVSHLAARSGDSGGISVDWVRRPPWRVSGSEKAETSNVRPCVRAAWLPTSASRM